MATWTTPMTYQVGFANRMTAALANQQWRDNLNYLYRNSARKSADEPLASNTTLQDDNHLTIPVLASEVYEFEFVLLYTAAAAGDLKVALSVPSGATGAWGGVGPDATTATNIYAPSFAAFGDATTAIFGGTGGNTGAFLSGTVVNSTTPGALLLRWAQGTSSATNTTIFLGSYVIAHRL